MPPPGFPEISGGKSFDEIRKSVLQLDQVAQLLKNKRIENGALRLDSPKLKFKLDKNSNLPYGISLEEVCFKN